MVDEEVEGACLVHLTALERLVLGDDLAHPRLDRLEVLGGERPSDVEVVVEAVLDGRTDGEGRPLEEVEHGLRHHMRSGVTDDMPTVLGALGDDLERRSVGKGRADVAPLAVDPDRHRRLGQPRADGGRGIEARRVVGELQLGSVR